MHKQVSFIVQKISNQINFNHSSHDSKQSGESRKHTNTFRVWRILHRWSKSHAITNTNAIIAKMQNGYRSPMRTKQVSKCTSKCAYTEAMRHALQFDLLQSQLPNRTVTLTNLVRINWEKEIKHLANNKITKTLIVRTKQIIFFEKYFYNKFKQISKKNNKQSKWKKIDKAFSCSFQATRSLS